MNLKKHASWLPWMALWLLSPGPLAAEELPWRAEVTTPPAVIPEPWRPLGSLLVDADGQAVETPADWRRQRRAILERWNEFLGPLQVAPLSNEFTVVRSETVGNVIRQRIEYEVEPGITVPAYLLRLAKDEPGVKRPGIVALHPTTTETIEPIAGVTGPEDKQTGIHLAEAGFVVICPTNFLWHDVSDYREAVARFQSRHPGSLGMSKMIWDARRAVDILEQVEGVDPDRIGTFGHSLGAKEVLYLMAFDERVQAGVFSEGGIALDSTNWDAPWYLGAGIRDDQFPLDHHEVLSLVAPRPLLILAGETGRGAADGDRSWPCVKAAQRVYALYPGPMQLGVYNHREGHAIPLKARERAIQWLRAGLERRPPE
jgi:dienelactone hydrolase